jgi:hypothetical protein
MDCTADADCSMRNTAINAIPKINDDPQHWFIPSEHSIQGTGTDRPQRLCAGEEEREHSDDASIVRLLINIQPGVPAAPVFP